VFSIPDDLTPLDEPHNIGEGDVPRARLTIGGREILIFGAIGERSWALLNLILTIVGVILVSWFGIRALLEKKRDHDDARFGTSYSDEENKKSRHRILLLAAAAIACIVAIIIFMLTQDMRHPMVLMDWWTLVHAIIFVFQILALLFVFRRLTAIFETDVNGEHFKKRVKYGASLNEPAIQPRPGYVFAGWYADQYLQNMWSFKEKVFRNIKLYARWERAV